MAGEQDARSAESQSRAVSLYRRTATVLLLLMAGVFLATYAVEAPGFWTRLLRAGAEAALVGGLADWFAVTAIFRRPLGLPIPHTAVIPRNKERIAQGLASFVERHFLDPALIAARIRSAGLSARFGRWLSTPANARTAARRLLTLAPAILDSLDDRQVLGFLQQALRHEVKSIDLAPLLGSLLELLRRGERHQEVFDVAVVAARRYLDENQFRVFEMIEDQSRWWVPQRIDRQVATALIRGVCDLLSDLERRDHEVRRRFDADVANLITQLRTSQAYAAKLNELRDQLLGQPQLQAFLAGSWAQLRAAVERGSRSPDTELHNGLSAVLQSLGTALAGSPEIQTRIDRRIEAVIRAMVTPWRAEIGRFIADVVRGWEARTIVERIELAVGRDLQYIRMNGTLVGAAVGCVIFLVTDRLA